METKIEDVEEFMKDFPQTRNERIESEIHSRTEKRYKKN